MYWRLASLCVGESLLPRPLLQTCSNTVCDMLCMPGLHVCGARVSQHALNNARVWWLGQPMDGESREAGNCPPTLQGRKCGRMAASYRKQDSRCGDAVPACVFLGGEGAVSYPDPLGACVRLGRRTCCVSVGSWLCAVSGSGCDHVLAVAFNWCANRLGLACAHTCASVHCTCFCGFVPSIKHLPMQVQQRQVES